MKISAQTLEIIQKSKNSKVQPKNQPKTLKLEKFSDAIKDEFSLKGLKKDVPAKTQQNNGAEANKD